MIYASVLKQNSTKLDSVPQEAKEIVILETVQGGGIKGYARQFASFLTLPIQSKAPPPITETPREAPSRHQQLKKVVSWVCMPLVLAGSKRENKNKRLDILGKPALVPILGPPWEK